VRPALIVGITGGIGSGKTTVADLFSSLQVPIIDADEIAKQAVMPGNPAYEEIIEQFGPGILTASGELDRRRLRERAFSDPVARTNLEEIIHPRVYAAITAQLAALNAPYAIVVVPLLIETGAKELVDRILVVDTSEESQIERTNRRDGTSRDTINKILAAQLDRRSRLSAADDVIENSSTVEALKVAVSKLNRKYLDEAARIASKQPKMKE
jgi:dephospho-CoA kinase